MRVGEPSARSGGTGATLAVVVLAAAMAVAPRGGAAHGVGHDAPRAAAENEPVGAPAAVAPRPVALAPAHAYFTDVELVNQHGESMRLYSDLLRGKTVVVSSFFTHCEDSCPIVMAKLAALQASLGERVGREVHLVSLSADPQRDTVTAIAEYARKFKAGPGWYLLTGSRENLDLANHKLGQYVSSPEGHRNVIVVGNEATGLWKKALAILEPAELDRLVRETMADR